MEKIEIISLIILITALLIIVVFYYSLVRPLGDCDNYGCKDKNGCYISLRHDVSDEVMSCTTQEGYEWNECHQSCQAIDYSARNHTFVNNYTICDPRVYRSYFKATNIQEVSQNISTKHFCGYLVIKNNETCNGNEYWDYIGTYNKCSTLEFKK